MSFCIRKHAKILFRQRKHDFERFSKLNSVAGLHLQTKIKPLIMILKQDMSTNTNTASDVDEQNQCHHIPVMTEEVLEMLDPREGQTMVDMTFGGGGHSRRILQNAPGVRLVAADRDPQAFRLAEQLAVESNGPSQVMPVLGRFSEVPHHLMKLGVGEGMVDGFLFDLGASSMQFDTPQRGFSISADGPLDMRMDGERFPDSPTAADVVNHLDPGDLSLIFKGYGEERLARSIAHAIVDARYAFGLIRSTKQLAEIVDTVFEGNHKRDKLMRYAHPATRVFQALRIFVNNELNELHNGLHLAQRFLRPGGRCAVISFHSLEDRIVKRHFHGIDIDAKSNLTVGDHFRNSARIHSMQEVVEMLEKKWRPLSKKVCMPSEEEVVTNPRSRSAKLRAAVKI